jgi:hypothetical protein
MSANAIFHGHLTRRLPNWSKLMVATITAASMTACVASNRALAPEDNETHKQIAVVAIQSVPLSLPSQERNHLHTLLGWTAIGNVFGLAAGIVFVAVSEATDDGSEAARRAEADAVLAKQEWFASRALAELAVGQINDHGGRRATLVNQARPFSSLPETGSFNLTGSDWLPGFNRWYNAETSGPRYGRLLSEIGVPEDADAVLEIASFEEFGFTDDYYIRVWMKLIDRRSGAVLARSLTIRGPRQVTDYSAWFRDDAIEYKGTVHALGGAAMREGLLELCLMPC